MKTLTKENSGDRFECENIRCQPFTEELYCILDDKRFGDPKLNTDNECESYQWEPGANG